MLQRPIGKSQMQAGVIALGTWAIGGGSNWGDSDQKESIDTIHEAIDLGVNLIDTAPAYNFGHSETVLGKALKGKRDKVLISTKCGQWWGDSEGAFFYERDGITVYKNLSPRCIKIEVENSLQRLDTDYIDIYFTHWQSVEPFVVPIQDTMTTLMDLKKQGKIRAIGACNVTVEQVKEYLKYGQLDIIQEKFSIIDRQVERNGLKELCEQEGITLQAYSPIEQGLLTGTVSRDYVMPPLHTHNKQFWWADERRNSVIDMVDSWKPLCEKYSCTPGNLAIAWSIAYSKQMNVLCGARKLHQIRDNVHASQIQLTEEDFSLMKDRADALINQYMR